MLKKAQNYIEKLANGENPLDDSFISDDSLINDVRISRCLFYVNDVLKQLMENKIVKNIGNHKKQAFEYDEELAQKIYISIIPISLSEIIQNICSVFNESKKLTYKQVASMLKDKGILKDNPQLNPKLIANENMADKGIWTELVERQNGKNYLRTLYNEEGQRLVIANLKDIQKYL